MVEEENLDLIDLIKRKAEGAFMLGALLDEM